MCLVESLDEFNTKQWKGSHVSTNNNALIPSYIPVWLPGCPRTGFRGGANGTNWPSIGQINDSFGSPSRSNGQMRAFLCHSGLFTHEWRHCPNVLHFSCLMPQRWQLLLARSNEAHAVTNKPSRSTRGSELFGEIAPFSSCSTELEVSDFSSPMCCKQVSTRSSSPCKQNWVKQQADTP